MAKGFEHLKSKRYWALILLGSPLRVIFAYAVFAGLHLGLGLPWPTLEDTGVVFSLGEFVGLLVLLMAMDRLVLGGIYGVNIFQRGWWNRKLTIGITGSVVAMLMTLAGYVAIMFAPIGFLKALLENDGSGAGLTGYLILTCIFYASAVTDGERELRERTE